MLNYGIDSGNGQPHAPDDLTQWKAPLVPKTGGWLGHNTYGRSEEKMFGACPQQIPDRPTMAESLYRLHNTGSRRNSTNKRGII